MGILISPSILGYESCLEDSLERIREITSAGIYRLHIDVMRKPFIPSRNAFPEESISRLYEELRELADFDFHLMVSVPDPVIEFINKTISDPERKKQTGITIHREAYRRGLGKYNSKDYDILGVFTGCPRLDRHLRDANVKTGEMVCKTLKGIKTLGYAAGLALEPGTSLDNITSEMAEIVDMILLMSVRSGEGGQRYMREVTEKIREARRRYGGKMIQVDGGVNEETIREVVEAGANNLVIGSYITKAEDLTGRINKIKTYTM